MKYSFTFAALAAVVRGIPFPQGVTEAISPSAPAPSGCALSYDGTFGIAVMNATAAAAAQPSVTQLPDGQPGAGTETGAISTLPDGQPQAPTGAVSTLPDGQPQAPTGAPPVSTIADGQPQAPTGAPPVSTIADGQPQAPTGAPPVSTIADGQPQAPTGPPAVSTIADGQPQAPTATITMMPVTQISDGQIQATTATMQPINQIGDGQIQNQAPTVTPVNTLSDGQPQNPVPTATPVNTLSDGQPQNPTGTAVNTLPDGQPQNPTTAVGSQPDGQPTASAGSGSGGTAYEACKQDDSLQVTLANGVLTDNQNRIGYIASNYQFQFDGPPQAGALYTSGFSVCSNGSLALGGSTIFYQCLSGDFYNLYDRNWAPQCNAINIQVVRLVDCAT